MEKTIQLQPCGQGKNQKKKRKKDQQTTQKHNNESVRAFKQGWN